MPRIHVIVIVVGFVYLIWRCYYFQQLLAMCEDFQQSQLEHQEINPLVKIVERAPSRSQVSHCTREDGDMCVPPLYTYATKYRIAEKNRLIACAVEKNFSTMLTAILCYLFDERRFLESKRNLTTEVYHQRFCASKNEYSSLTEIEAKVTSSLHDWQKIAVVRDPLEKFASGFADKCLREQTWKKFPNRCNKCKTNLKCFMERQYARLLKRATGVHSPVNFDDDHFSPQNWRCEFSTHLHDFQILHFDSSRPSGFTDSLLAVLKKNNVTERAMHFIKSSIESKRTSHSTKDTVEHNETRRAILSNPHLLDLLIRMYYYDYVLFGYRIPAVQTETNKQ
ncbi:hypothetical protein V3C99_005263 [Haemonchus contortus]|uniref:Carbohydrate sulfotransferase n=1 Tax=Haemonchus contortus TaxID=6289 RepID=A0A7I4XWL0_HAECO